MEVERTVMNCFDDSVEQPSPDQEPSKKLSSGATTAPPPPSPNAYFDCSICLDFAVDPVVTLCGHLYCWPCIYKWLQVETTSPHQCPVCKAPLSKNALVPLYGRGGLTAKTKGSHNQSLNIPNRPPVLRDVIASVIEEHSSSTNDEYIDLHPPMQRQPLHHHHHHHHHHYPYHSNVFNSTAGGVLGGLAIAILPLVSRSRNEVGESMYISRPYQLIENGNSPSQRRHGMRVENWLHQIWVFLFCCAVLCLLLF